MMLRMCVPFSVVLELSSRAIRDAGVYKVDKYITFPVTLKCEFLLKITSTDLYAKPMILRRINGGLVHATTCYLIC